MDYWNNLTQRDKIVATIGGICLIIYVLYLFIYSPLTAAVDANSAQLQEKKETLAWMNDLKDVKPSANKKIKLSSGQLLSQLSNKLKKTAFAKFQYQLEQTTSGEVQLTFTQVPFIPFMKWLKEISSEYNIVIKSMDASRTETPGIAKLSLTIATTES